MKIFWLLFFGFTISHLSWADPLIADIPTENVLKGQFEPQKRHRFIEAAQPYANRPGIFLQTDTYFSFLKMAEAAQKEGVNLVIIKGFSPSKTTKKPGILGRMVRKQKTPSLSEIALANRYAWGTDFALNALNGFYFKTGEGEKIADWLKQHAIHFGFFQPFPESKPWQWSYQDLSGPYEEYCKKGVN